MISSGIMWLTVLFLPPRVLNTTWSVHALCWLESLEHQGQANKFLQESRPVSLGFAPYCPHGSWLGLGYRLSLLLSTKPAPDEAIVSEGPCNKASVWRGRTIQKKKKKQPSQESTGISICHSQANPLWCSARYLMEAKGLLFLNILCHLQFIYALSVFQHCF